MGFTNHFPVRQALTEITSFNHATGMTSNADKTKYITTLFFRSPLSLDLPDEWRLVKEVKSYKYLGLLMGNTIDINDVFMEAWRKLSRRVASYMPYKNYYNTQTRVIISNSFLSPIFSYLFRFYLMGEHFQTEVEALLTKWLVPASRFRYDHLTARTKEAGLTQPLHDIRLVNIAAILRNQPSNNLPRPNDDSPRYDHGDGSSLAHSEHVKRAAYFYHDITDSDPPPETSQRELFKSLHQKDITPTSSLANKFEKVMDEKSATTKARLITKHTSELPSSLPSKLRYHAFELVYNAIPTRMRERWRNHPTICPLCNAEDETIHHLHTCTTSQLSVGTIEKRFPDRSLISCLYNFREDDLTFEGTHCTPRQRLVKLIFSLSIWRTRRHFLRPFDQTTPKKASRKISNYFIRTYQSILHKKNRKKRDRVAEKKTFMDKFSKISPRARLTFTDGSSFGNPGLGGAGYYMLTRSSPVEEHLFFSIHLPNTTNNKAELLGLIIALNHLRTGIEDGDFPTSPDYHIFVDNQYAIDATLGNSRPRSNLSLVRDARRAYGRLSGLTTAHITWVPGHAKIFYDEVADHMAKRGSRKISSRDPPPR